MPLHANAVGTSIGSLEISHDDRWVMAYAAGVPDERPELFDTASGVVVHPLFPVAPEWALIISRQSGGTGLSDDEARRGIHVGHDLLIERPLRGTGRLHIEGQLIAVDARRMGATQTALFTATDDEGAVVWRTRMTSLLLGVALEGEPTSLPIEWPHTPGMPESQAVVSQRSTVRSVDAHVYSECARIWNPIHTDVVAARRSGLGEPILHGTATLARAVSIATELAGVSLASVQRVVGSFKAPVPLGSWFEVRLLGATPTHLWFDAVNADGSTALSDGLLGLRP